MRFVVVHKVCSYLMVLTSLAALFTSGQLHPLLPWAIGVGLAISWWWEPPRVDLARMELPWNILTLAMLGYTTLDLLTGGPLILGGVHFILFLTLNKLFNRRASRDYLQLYVLSFLQMIAGTTLNTELAYGLLFAVYIIFTTWTLILFHLKREMEENYLLKYGDSLHGRPVQVQRVLNSRKLVGGRFLAATSAVSVLVFAGSATVFFLFPRVGFGFFFKQRRPGIAMAGFGDRVELGHHGTIKDNPTVVMRVQFKDPAKRNTLRPYWRGIALDHYDGKTWTRSVHGANRSVSEHGTLKVNPMPPQLPIVEQEIYLEPMETRVLFGLTRIGEVSLERQPGPPALHELRRIESGADGALHYEQRDEVAFRYFVRSGPEIAPKRHWKRSLDEYRSHMSRYTRLNRQYPYLQLPSNLSPRVRALAQSVIGDATTVGEAVKRVETHLKTAYSYTLDLKRDERFAPLEDFLFVQKRGHCEYFSTAMVVLLRSQGIAARNVNGFLGGVWNDYGSYMAVSQGDAHSWVEVFLDIDDLHPHGVWVTRDPTPSGRGRARKSSAWTQMLQYADALRLRWYKYIIEYDLQTQVSALSQLQNMWRSSFSPEEASQTQGAKADPELRRIFTGAILLAIAIAIIIAWRNRRRGGAGAGGQRAESVAVADLYSLLIAQYARMGFARLASATHGEYLASLERKEAPSIELAEQVVRLYESVRFGGAEPPHNELSRLRGEVKRMRRASPPASEARP